MRKLYVSSFIVGFLWALFWLPSAVAQQLEKGTVAGTAKDSGGSTLQGAIVQLNPAGKQVVTDTQGQFRITDIVPGSYTLTASYVGFAPFTKEGLKVEAGVVTSVDAVLEVASRNDQVIVTAERVQGE